MVLLKPVLWSNQTHGLMIQSWRTLPAWPHCADHRVCWRRDSVLGPFHRVWARLLTSTEGKPAMEGPFFTVGWVWCGRTESSPQAHSAPLGWTGTEIENQSFWSSISVWPHKCSAEWMGKNSHGNTPESCVKPSHKSGSRYGKGGINSVLMCMYLE